jgi:hypothetical protein
MKWSTSLFVSVLGLTTIGLTAAAQTTAVDLIVYSDQRKPNLTLGIIWLSNSSLSTGRGNLQGSVATLPHCKCDVTFTCKGSSVKTPDIAVNVRAKRIQGSKVWALEQGKWIPWMPEKWPPTAKWTAWKKKVKFSFLISLHRSVKYRVACEEGESGNMRTLTVKSAGENCPDVQNLLCNSTRGCEYAPSFKCHLAVGNQFLYLEASYKRIHAEESSRLDC